MFWYQIRIAAYTTHLTKWQQLKSGSPLQLIVSSQAFHKGRPFNLTQTMAEMTQAVFRTHPQGLDDQVAGLQLSFHDAQQGEQLGLAQIIHVELTFLQHRPETMGQNKSTAHFQVKDWYRILSLKNSH